jgi:hypothetical protein
MVSFNSKELQLLLIYVANKNFIEKQTLNLQYPQKCEFSNFQFWVHAAFRSATSVNPIAIVSPGIDPGNLSSSPVTE